jgi:putative transposase
VTSHCVRCHRAARETGGVKPPPDPHYRHPFPAEIISHAVWLYHVFNLSLRDVELILAERGIVVSYETVRRWCKKSGATLADRLRRRRLRPGGKSGTSTRVCCERTTSNGSAELRRR